MTNAIKRADDPGPDHLAGAAKRQPHRERQTGESVGVRLATELDVDQTKFGHAETGGEQQQHHVAVERDRLR